MGDIFVIQNGYSFKSSDYVEFISDELEVLKMGHIERGGGLRKEPKKNYVPRSEKLKKWILDKGNIVIAMTDMKDNVVILGVPALIDKDDHYVLNQRVAGLRLKEKNVDLDFVYNYLKWDEFLGTLRSKANSGVQVNLTTDAIKNSIILLPPPQEQKAIAEVLSSFDEKIDLLHRQNKTLEGMAQALFRKWFVENPEREKWEVGKLGDEFDFTMGQSPPGTSYNEKAIGIPMFQGNADFEFRFPKNRIYTTEPKRFAEKFDTLISVRAPVGEQNMASDKCCIGRGVAAFRYNKDNSFYTYTYFKLMSLMDEIKQFNQTGTVFGSISKKDFENISINIPPDNAIQNFQEIVQPIDDKIIKNEDQIRTLENLRDTLLPKLMSGEVRLKDFS